MFERFTDRARQVVVTACEAAERSGQRRVRPEHLLLGVAAAGGLGASVLAGFGLHASTVDRAVTRRDPRTVLSDAEVAALRAVGIDAEEVFRRIEEAFGDTAWFTAEDDAEPECGRGLFGKRRRSRGGRFEKEAKQALEQSLRQALALKHKYIGTEHILLGLLALPQPPLPDLLASHGVTYDLVRERVLEALRPAV